MDWSTIINQILNLFTSSIQPVPTSPVQGKKIILLTRTESSPTAGIFGTISLSWDAWVGASLENFALAIPTGTYSLMWHVSPHLGNATVPMLVDVTGRTEILIHWGNVEGCSEGCILCGTVRDGDAIDATQTACQTLYAKIKTVGIENVQITVK